MKRTKLTYSNSPVYLDENNCLWFYKQGNGCNVETYILWEQAPQIKGDNLFRMVTELESKIIYHKGKIIYHKGKIQVNKNYIKNILQL